MFTMFLPSLFHSHRALLSRCTWRSNEVSIMKMHKSKGGSVATAYVFWV